MKISKAVVTAAGPNQNRLPLQRFVNLGGTEKTALQIIIEEVVAAGVEELCVVIRPGDQAAYAEAAGEHARMLTFIEQPRPRGYGDALYRAKEFVADEPFVHLVSDHLYISGESRRCAAQLVEAARANRSPVSAVQATRESMLITSWPFRRSPIRSAAVCAASAVTAGCFAWGIPATIRCGFARSCSSGHTTGSRFRSWSSGRPCGWIFRTAPGATSSFWGWTFRKAHAC
ncbi:MAG: sugar phosphate nucleotidyltransferase [Thermoguttaceae bacterium]